MSRLPHFRSDSELHRDGDDSQSMSQARARPAIRLDTSLSFISTTSFMTGGGPASPLLGDSLSTAAVASPTLLFQTRDVNTETARQRSLHSLKASHSHSRHDRCTASDSRSMTSASQAPFSQTSCGVPPSTHSQKASRPHPWRLPPQALPAATARDQHSPASTSLSVGRRHPSHRSGGGGDDADDGDATSKTASRHRYAAAVDAGAAEATHRLDLLESEPTLLTRPSEPRSGRDGEDGARGRRGQSGTVSPAPRHAVTLSDDFDGGFSSLAPSELADGADEAGRTDRAASGEAHPPGTGTAAPRSRSSVLANGGLEDSSAEEDAEGAEQSAPEGRFPSSRGDRCSTTPPPRRAFVLSRRYSSADSASDGAPAVTARPADAASGAATTSVACDAAPRGSAVLVLGGEDGEDETQATPAVAAAATFALHRGAPPTLPVGRLRPGVVVEESEERRHASTAAATATRTAARRRSSSSSSGGESESMMSPLPRPLQPPVFARRAHRDETTESATEPQQQQQRQQLLCPHTQGEKHEGAADHVTASLSPPTVEKTAATAATASTTAQDFTSFSMHSSTLPANTTTATAASDAELRGAAPLAADAVATSEPAPLLAEPPLNSMMMAASTRTTTATTTATAASSVWLVSGSTPTPLRHLRARGHGHGGGDGDGNGATSPVQLSGAPMRASSLTTAAAADSPAVAVSEAVSAVSVALDLHAEAAATRERRCSPARGSPPTTTPSFSPEPAPPAPSHAATVAAATALPPPSSSAALAEVRDATPPPPPPVRADAHTRPTASFRYSTANVDVSMDRPTAGGTAAAAATVGLSSPSSAESTRVSEEVKELVERAQAEVRRTRESLLSTLREHRTSFHLVEPSPTPRDTRQPQPQPHTPQPFVVTVRMSPPSAPPTPSRSLLLPTVTDATTPAHTAAAMPPQEPSSSAAPASRTSGEWRAAAATLRPQLRAAADAIERRLRGYDARDHGVLPMETVVRVAYYVVTRRQMPLATWSLRTADGAVAATPLRVSMLQSNSPLAKGRAGEELEEGPQRVGGVARLAGTPLAATVRRGLETPRVQRSAFHAEVSSARYSSAKPDTALLSPGRCSDVGGVVRTRAGSRGGEEGGSAMRGEAALRGRPATCMSPSRTLEHVMAQQHRRAEEQLYLHFYFTVLEAFRQVFGERYAWRHLGATNASRHDCRVRAPLRKSRRTTDAPASAGWREGGHAGAEAEAHLVDIENELNAVAAPLETLFPRLRQQYALAQQERHEGDAVDADDSSRDSTATDAAAAAAGFAHRPPPLDVLVYYHTFVSSLREL